jgi:nucleotide-binding universal stress UspA family protein
MEHIVVGVDGSDGARAALRWADELAGRHGADIVAVLAWSYFDQRHPDGDREFDPHYGEDDARAALTAAIEAAGATHVVEQRVVLELPERALVDAAEGADLVVVGARGLGGFKGLLLGSVSERVLERSPAPVAVIRQEQTGAAGGPVVVGVDGSDTSTRALRWAAVEARLRDVPLRVVHAWQMMFAAVPATEPLIGALEEGGRAVLDAALADPALEGLDVKDHLVPMGATEGVLRYAHDASLVVVGSRGLGRVGRVLLGSTSRQLAHHAPCPIVVVPPAAAGD